MKMFLIDTENNMAEVVDCNDKLETLYKLIDCDYIEIVQRTVNGVQCNIICDEEGKLRGKNKVSGIMIDESDYFVGNILLCGLADSDGDLTGLTDLEISKIKENIIEFDYHESKGTRKVLDRIEY